MLILSDSWSFVEIILIGWTYGSEEKAVIPEIAERIRKRLVIREANKNDLKEILQFVTYQFKREEGTLNFYRNAGIIVLIRQHLFSG